MSRQVTSMSSVSSMLVRHGGWLALAAAFSLLAGCRAGPDYVRPTLALPAHYQAAAELPEQREPAAPWDRWWLGFADPQLTALIEKVQRDNLDLAAAQARLLQARALARQAGTAWLPQGALDGEVLRQRQSLQSPLGMIGSQFPGYTREQTLQQIDTGASWELDLSGGLHRQAEAAVDQAQANAAQWQALRLSLAAETADAYLQWRQAAEAAQLVQARLQVDQQLVEQVTQRIGQGVAVSQEQDDAQAQLAQDQAELPLWRSQLAIQANRLDVLAGQPAGTSVVRATADYPWQMPGVPADLQPAQLLRRRPDIIAAERQLAAANAGIGVAQSQYYPQISLGALLGFERLGTGNLFNAQAFQPGVLAGLHWRLFDFGRVAAEVEQAKGRRAEALAQYRQAALRASEDVEDALTVLAQADARRNASERWLAAQRRAEQATSQDQRFGTANGLDLLRRQRQVLLARQARLSMQADQSRATVGVYRALGGGWSDDAVAANASAAAR